MDPQDKRRAYAADITYGTNNEFGFDYPRDNMAMHVEERFQRGLHYAIVDEVDSILIDEARTRSSSPARPKTAPRSTRMNEVAPLPRGQKEEKKPDQPEPPGDFYVDEKNTRSCFPRRATRRPRRSSRARACCRRAPACTSRRTSTWCTSSTRRCARTTFPSRPALRRAERRSHRRRIHRPPHGRTALSDGLHQAVEAKEKVQIQNENQTLASITFQNYFRMYGKLAGMTGTADTEAYEFQQIYGLETVVVPTHMKMIRADRQDQVYRTAKEKYTAVIKDIRDCYERGQPVLVGTTSIENSSFCRACCKEKLRAPGAEREAARARSRDRRPGGRPKMITIATNMAGRGTDIVLGGNVEKQCDFVEADASLESRRRRRRNEKLRGEWQALHDQRGEGGRPAHHRHRAP